MRENIVVSGFEFKVAGISIAKCETRNDQSETVIGLFI